MCPIVGESLCDRVKRKANSTCKEVDFKVQGMTRLMGLEVHQDAVEMVPTVTVFSGMR